MSTQAKTFITPEEYLAAEREAESKSEYFDGEVFLMSGASLEHNLIVANVVASLVQQLRGKECSALPNDMRVHIPATGLFTYPDVIVVCGKPLLKEDGYFDTLLNPTLIVEVLSPSTANYDRGQKFEHYRSLNLFQEYLLVEQHECKLARYTRQPDESWVLKDFRGANTRIELMSVGCVLTLADVYDKVTFPE
ncbi:MAG TPA: Uma2 family endonuclease [Pyrinomonadaceae bacterium]|nr:Uma2 family endonuclease [Pyrinomonadaceae bacterium]